jgi:hypothetical protein
MRAADGRWKRGGRPGTDQLTVVERLWLGRIDFPRGFERGKYEIGTFHYTEMFAKSCKPCRGMSTPPATVEAHRTEMAFTVVDLGRSSELFRDLVDVEEIDRAWRCAGTGVLDRQVGLRQAPFISQKRC